MVKAEGHDQERQQQRCHQELHAGADEHDLKAQKGAGAKLTIQQTGAAHVDGPGHQIALDPARPLLDPCQRMAIRLFLGRGGDHLGAKAMPGQTNAKIGILGHAIGIPAANPLKHVATQEQRRATQGHGQAQPGDPRQDQAEPARIFGCETAA